MGAAQLPTLGGLAGSTVTPLGGRRGLVMSHSRSSMAQTQEMGLCTVSKIKDQGGKVDTHATGTCKKDGTASAPKL